MIKINKNNIIVILSLFFICIIPFYELIFGGKVIVSGDNLSPIAIKNGIKNYINEFGTYPLWLPWIFSGMPSVHSLLNISDYYLPHRIIVLLNDLGLPWVWNFLIHLIYGGYGMYKFEYYDTLLGILLAIIIGGSIAYFRINKYHFIF